MRLSLTRDELNVLADVVGGEKEWSGWSPGRSSALYSALGKINDALGIKPAVEDSTWTPPTAVAAYVRLYQSCLLVSWRPIVETVQRGRDTIPTTYGEPLAEKLVSRSEWRVGESADSFAERILGPAPEAA